MVFQVMSRGLTTQELLKSLVGFATVSRDSNLELIDFIRRYMSTLGVESELFYNTDLTKAALFATIGPSDRGGIVLSGHTDVVPVDGQVWTVDPFRLTENDGRLYGRGTADMKGFIASVLAAVPGFLAQPLQIPVHLAFSYDEEIGCLGVRPMLAELAKRPNKPRMCLIGEPTELKPVLGHKGKLSVRCCVHGSACHTAYAPYGVNAISYAARLIIKLEEIGERLADPRLHDDRFDPPFSTVQVGLINGGVALNIVPAHCEFDFEVRALPKFDAHEVLSELHSYAQYILLPKMRAIEDSTEIQMQPLSTYPGLSTPSDNEAARLLSLLCETTDYETVPFGTEGGLFDESGIPSVVCGPGSMDQGHKPDEFITKEQLTRCDFMLSRLTRYLQMPDKD